MVGLSYRRATNKSHVVRSAAVSVSDGARKGLGMSDGNRVPGGEIGVGCAAVGRRGAFGVR